MVKEKKLENRLGFKKFILLVFLVLLLIAGIGYKIYMRTNSKTFTAAGVIISAVGIAIIIILFYIFKNKKGNKFVGITALGICILIIGINLYYLRADYFIPHESTSYHNRNAQYALRSSFAIEEYLEDKIIYMDPENNNYYDWEYELVEYTTMHDVIALNLVARSIETYPEKIEVLQLEEWINYLLTYDEKDYIHIVREDNWNRDLYIYIGEGYEESDSMIFLVDIHNRMFFVTPQIYEEFKLAAGK